MNAITQYKYGRAVRRYVSYDAVDDCMHELAVTNGITPLGPIAMPKLGAGLGGGDWTVISAIIEHRLRDMEVTVYTLD